MEYKIREATVSDAREIARLNQTSMGYDYPIEKTTQKLALLLSSGKDKIFVAVADNAVVGYVHANDYDVLYAPAMKNIMGIAVSPAYRRAGIGRALITAVESWARETDAKGIRLVSGAGRTNAHDFYRSLGFGGGKNQINFKKYFD